MAFNIALLNTIARIDSDCHMEVLASSPVNQLLEDTPYIDQIHVRPKSFIADLVLHTRQLRKDWDVVFVGMGGGHLQLFYRFLQARHKRHRAYKDDVQGKHEIEIQLSMLEGILEGWNDLVDPRIHFGPKRTTKIIDKLGLNPGEKYLSISPGASHAGKMWDKSKFVALGRAMGMKYDRIMVLGDSSEHELCEYVASNVDGMNLAGEMGLLDVCALLSLVSLHIGNDSGLGHLAASSGTKCVAIGDENGPQKAPWQQHMLLGDVKQISLEQASNFILNHVLK